jgi:hypothetical protein
MKSLDQTKIYIQFIWLSFFPILLLISFYFSWALLSSQSFLYEFWYDNTKLESFIDLYAPQNNNKPEFALTSREERIRVFSEILDSVNNSGKGLAEISFKGPDGEFLGLLLNQPEIEHLELVSIFVSMFKSISVFSLLVLVIFLVTILRNKIKIPDMKIILITYLIVLMIFSVSVLLIGPQNLFVFLHKEFFPDNHQWFFYYQDSLMTTLMMAPDLFGYFALAWSILAIIIFIFFVFLIKNTEAFLNSESAI